MADMKTRTMRHKNKLNLGLDLPRSKSTTPSGQDRQIPGALGNNTSDPGTLEIGVEFKLDLRNEDLVVLKELGAGNGGTVSKVMHSATKVIMAKKVIWIFRQSALFLGLRRTGYPCGREERREEAHCSRNAHHARLHLTEYYNFLRSFSTPLGRCRYVYGVHGLRVCLPVVTISELL